MCRKPFDKNFTKTTGVFVNLLYMIAGIVMLGFGISIKATPEYFLSMYGHQGVDVLIACDGILEASAIFMVVVSVLSIASGAFGIYCFITETDLYIFAALQVFLMTTSTCLIIFTAAFPSKDLMREKMSKKMINTFLERDILVDNASLVTYLPIDAYDRAWAATQLGTSCCGIDGPRDYLRIPAENREVDLPNFGKRILPVPLSCCLLKPDHEPMELLDFEGCVTNETKATNKKGCLSSVMIFYAYSAVSVYRITPIMIAFEAGLIFLSLKFAYDLRNYECIP